MEENKYTPVQRMGHASATLGAVLLIHGGYNTEQRKYKNDITLFDMKQQKWIRTLVCRKGDDKINNEMCQTNYDKPCNCNQTS